MKTIKRSELSENLREQLKRVAESDEVYRIVTGKQKEEVVLMSLQEFNSLRETDHLFRSEANRTRLLESIAQIDKEEVVDYTSEKE